MVLRKLGFNDMIGKGWDSPAQESFCWKHFYDNGATTNKSNQFWWVPAVWQIHGHAWGWEDHKRRPDGTFLKFPPAKGKGEGEGESEPKPKRNPFGDRDASTIVRLLRLATLFSVEDGDKAEELIKVAKALSNGKIAI